MAIINKIRLSIFKNNMSLGVLLLVLGIMAPLIINVESLIIIPLLEDSIRESDAGKLIMAAFKLVLLNSFRALPIYLGAFCIAESIVTATNNNWMHLARGLVASIVVPLVYKLIFWIYNISYDFGVPAIMVILAIILIEYLNLSNISLINKSVIIMVLLFSVQWMDIIPTLSAYGFGRGEISSDIKLIAGFINSTQILTFASFTLFILFIFIALLIGKMLCDENKLIATMERNKEIEKGLLEVRLLALESRKIQEMQTLVHDLKTPLSSIQALVSVSQMITDDEKIRQYMGKVTNSVDNLNNMISQILYEDRKSIIKTEELFEYVLSQLAPNKNKDKIKYCNRCEDRYILANKIVLSRAIINILGNAFDAIDENGDIDMAVACQDRTINIIIEDNGTGIDKEDLDRIWEAGFSTKNSTGLGLSFVKEVIDKHGGSIEFFSTKGQGTRILIKLLEAENIE